MNQNTRRLSDYIPTDYFLITEAARGASMPNLLASVANRFGAVTVGFDNQYHGLLDTLETRRTELAQTVRSQLAQEADYTGSRNAGVKLAWQYEQADIQMGGKGSAHWTRAEREEILHSKTGTVSGAEGHHQKNVVDHPEYQADPDNIKFYKSRQEHLQQGHNGNFQNESDAPFIDKNKMLAKTNNRRVFVNEMKGAGISAVIGFGTVFTISAVAELARAGIDSVEMGELIGRAMKTGIEGGTISTVTYGTGRLVSSMLQKQGVDLLTKTGALVNFAAVGTISIILVSTYQFFKMEMRDIETSVALKEVGKQALFSISVLATSIVAQGIYGGCAGIVVSTGVGFIALTAGAVQSAHQRKLETQIKEYTIEECRPLLV